MRIADVLANSLFGKILAMQTLRWLYQYIKYKSINVTCKVCFGHRLPNRSRRKFLFKQLISGCVASPILSPGQWSGDPGDKLSDVTTRAMAGWWSEDIRDYPAQAGQMGLRCDDDHFIECGVPSFMPGGIRWGMQRAFWGNGGFENCWLADSKKIGDDNEIVRRKS